MSLDAPKTRTPRPLLWLKVGWLLCSVISLGLCAYLLTSFNPGLARAPDRHGYGALIALSLLVFGVAAFITGGVAAVVGIALPGGQWTRRLTVAVALACLSAQAAIAYTFGFDVLLTLAATPAGLCLATVVIMCLPSIRSWYALGSQKAKEPAISEYTRHRR